MTGPFQTVRLTFRDALNHKLYIIRSNEKSKKNRPRIFSDGPNPLFLAILGLTSQSKSVIAPKWADLEIFWHAHCYEHYQRPCQVSGP